MNLDMSFLSQASKTIETYFKRCTLYQMIAWGAIALGLILLIAALIIGIA